VAFLIDFAIAGALFLGGSGHHFLSSQTATPAWARTTKHINIELNFFENWYSIVYLVLFFGLSVYLGNGRTIGKRVMGIRVVSLVHHRMGLWHSIERALGYGASALEFRVRIRAVLHSSEPPDGSRPHGRDHCDPRSACSGDLPSRQRGNSGILQESMFLRSNRGSRTARSTATTRWWKAGVCNRGKWRSGRCCIWAKSTTASKRHGARRWKCSMKRQQRYTPLSLFPEDRPVPADALDSVQVKLSEMKLERARPYGNCWLGCELWRQLQLDRFWSEKLPRGREGVAWPQVLELLVVNRLIDPGSEFRLHRQWFDHSAMDVLLGQDFAVAEKDRLYRCLDRVLEHKQDLFVHLQQRWKDLFDAEFDLLLYDLTSTYVEGEAEQNPKARYGYSRDKRPDCKQVVIALIVTPAGLPLAYEVMAGNTSEKTTLRGFLDKHRKPVRQSAAGVADGPRNPDRGSAARNANVAARDVLLVGTSRAKVKQYEKKWLELALAESSRIGGSEAVRPGRRVVCAGQK
jgi:hypothetical protein